MAIAFRSGSNTAYASRTNITITAPAGIADGDILVALIATGSVSTPPVPSTPTGWAAFGTDMVYGIAASFEVRLRVFWKRAASESGSYTFNHSAASSAGWIGCFSGALAAGTPLNATSTNTGTGTTSTGTGITTTAANSYLLWLSGDFADFTADLTPPTGMTERLDAAVIYAASELRGAAGATGNRSMTNNNNSSTHWAARMVELLETAPPITLVGVGTNVQVTATTHTLVEPAGVLPDDLLVACIGSRIASVTQITLPAGWVRANQALTNNVAADTTGLGSAMMAYIIRGASAPSFTFTHPVAPSVAVGRVIAYRSIDAVAPHIGTEDSGQQAGPGVTACSWTGLTTSQANDLIVTMCVGGRAATYANFNATDPGTSAGTVDNTTTPPTAGTWFRRAGITTTTGADTALAIFDAIKASAGATGNFTATASLSGGHALITSAFKYGWPAGTIYNETVAETATAAETVALLTESLVRETEAADWRETEDGNIRITEGDFFVTPPIEASVAESASAADTVTGARIYTCAIAETAGANETITITLLRIGATVESAAAADTSSGLLTRIGAVAETASAVETTDASIVPAAGIFDKMVVETAPVVDSTDTSVIFTRAIVESASAAETIGKTLSLTSAISETAAAADTVGGLAVRAGAIAESAAAVETTAGLLTRTVAVVETAAAAETITYSLTGAAGTTYNEAVPEVAVAADTLTGRLTALGAVAEAAVAFETITRAVSYTKAIVETATATETIGKTVSYSRAIVESATAAETIGAAVVPAAGVFNESVAEAVSAADTVGCALVRVAAIVETAAAAELTDATVIRGAVTFDETVAETANAADTLTVIIRRWIRETPPPWANWVEEATAAAEWTASAPEARSWNVDTAAAPRATEAHGVRYTQQGQRRIVYRQPATSWTKTAPPSSRWSRVPA